VEKHFRKWVENKERIHARQAGIDFHFSEREIWWCALGCNVGNEEDGKNDNFERPIIIFRKFDENILWAIPITTRLKSENSRILCQFSFNGESRTADICQLRLISSKRLLRYMGILRYSDFQYLRRSLLDPI
jgi:mRNA interferase MazF